MKNLSNKIKNLIEGNKTLLSNFSYLSILQISLLFMPLIAYPYLIRVLGKELYGLVIFTTVIAGYFTIFISFGFSMTGAKEVSIHRDNFQKLSEIVSAILIIKSVLLLVCFLVLYGYFILYPSPYQVLYYLAFGACLLDVIFPQWFFQGIEKMKFITMISLGARLVFLGLIFVFVEEQSDVLWFPLANLVATVISGTASFYLIKKEGVRFVTPSFLTIKHYIKESYHFFLSNVLIQIYVNSNKAIIGTFLGMGAVAYYDLAEKIVNLIRIPQGIISQVSFPRISSTKSTSFIKKIFRVSLVINIFLYILLFFTAEYIVLLLGGKEMLSAVPIVQILGLLAPVVAVSNTMGILTLVPFGFNKLFTKMIGFSVVSYLAMFVAVWGLDIISVYSLSVVNVLTEVIVTIISIYFVYKTGVLWKKNTII
ncbi:oligosaccharide flippase family protein [Mannheimia bovis]|uniref:Oligosaccharide flippase family protein n=1 Tax=Mannheimia bovis TaxID=2770636 RepID=A0A7H1C350_9PAST|nr:oligosaccharide flippase family protein [Mannheimia bovis]QNS15405.1 oligosaccharide flippase family protein [Mannheimia bovis]